MSARANPTSLPSSDALQRRVERAERQAAFAEGAGWTEVAQLYRHLAAELRTIAARPEARS